MYTEISGHRTFFSHGNGQLHPEQRNIVFIHGAGMDHSVWVMPARYFARHKFNVYALDLPGHGRSMGAALSSIDALADWVDTALNKLNIDQTAVVGHSMGSLVGLNLAARHPDKVSHLALLGTSIPMPVGAALLDAAKSNHHDAIDMSNTWSHSSFGQMGGNANPGLCMTMGGQRLLEQTAEDVFFADLNACNNFTNGKDLLPAIKARTLVIAGREDKMTAVMAAREVTNTIPNCHYVELSPCGHSMLSERPNEVLDALSEFIR